MPPSQYGIINCEKVYWSRLTSCRYFKYFLTEEVNISAFHYNQWKLCCFETLMQLNITATTFQSRGLSAGTGKLCIFGHLGLVFIWSCFVSCLLLLLYYVICAPVLTEGTQSRLVFLPHYAFHAHFIIPQLLQRSTT